MRLKNGFAVSQHSEIFKESCICIKNTQISMIRSILQARKEMQFGAWAGEGRRHLKFGHHIVSHCWVSPSGS